MIDITKQYKVEVKKLRNQLGIKSGTLDSNILPSKAHHTVFTKNASNVLTTIAQVHHNLFYIKSFG